MILNISIRDKKRYNTKENITPEFVEILTSKNVIKILDNILL
jgi:hypothetical protein